MSFFSALTGGTAMLLMSLLTVAVFVVRANEILYADMEAADTFIDNVLDEMRYSPEMKDKLDPLSIPTFGEGNYEVSNGRVYGLLGFTRNGNSSVLYAPDGDTVVVSTMLTADQVSFFGSHTYSKGFVTIRGDIEAKIARIDANSIVRMPAEGGTSSKLESLMILRMHDLEITRITGVSRAFNWLLKIVANRVAKQFQLKIENAFEREITPNFRKFLSDRSSPPFNGSAELTETPFEGELPSESTLNYAYPNGFLG